MQLIRPLRVESDELCALKPGFFLFLVVFDMHDDAVILSI